MEVSDLKKDVDECNLIEQRSKDTLQIANKTIADLLQKIEDLKEQNNQNLTRYAQHYKI